MTKPESIRQLRIAIGSHLCVIGDDGPPLWYDDVRVPGTLTAYVVLEIWPALQRIWARLGNTITWDVAALVSLNKPLMVPQSQVSSYSKPKIKTDDTYSLTQLLLIQRYPNFAWDDTQESDTVFAFGVRQNVQLDTEPLVYDDWYPKTIQLTTHSLLKFAENCTWRTTWCTEQRGCLHHI